MDRGSGRSRPRRSTPLERIGGFVSGRPRLVLAVWLLAVLVLTLRGVGIEDRLLPPQIYLDGTASNRANEIALRYFGDEEALVVMLRGPKQAIESQGRQLDRELDALPGTRVFSPWGPAGAIEGLRPSPRVAALVVSVRHDSGSALTDVLPPVRDQLDDTIRSPVRADLSGAPSIVDSIRSAATHAARSGERISIPVMLLVLLLVFRSAVAAAVPVIVGGAVVAASRGVFDVLAGVMDLEVFAVGALAMMGLALGVDYSLLVVSRFREERRNGADPPDAVRTTVATAGRSVVSAGSGLVLAMLVAMPLLPGAIVSSIAMAVIVTSILSMLSALFVVPAVLTLLGPNLERWSLPHRAAGEGMVARWSRRLIRRPRLVTVPVIVLLVAGTAYAFALDTGVATAGLLPPDDEGRRQHEEVERVLGPGWGSPFEIVVDGRERPMTSPYRLRALAAFERRVEQDPAVEAVAGFSSIERGTRQLAGLERKLAAQERGLVRLGRGVAQARGGAEQAAGGLRRAAGGAGTLHAATGEAHRGADRLTDGMHAATDGSESLVGGIGKASDGSERLSRGADRASTGAARLKEGLAEARAEASSVSDEAQVLKNDLETGSGQLTALGGPLETTREQLAVAWRALQRMTSGRGDPEFETALQAVGAASGAFTGADPATGDQASADYEGVAAGIEDAQGQFSLGLYLAERMRKQGSESQQGIRRLARGAERLDDGVERVAEGSTQISDGLEELRSSGTELPEGLGRLSRGAERLAGGLGQLEAGANQLTGGLGNGAASSDRLTGGLERMESGISRQRAGSETAELREGSPGLFDSGYFYLASLDGTSPRKRSQAGYVVSVDRGGLAARMQVIPKEGSRSPETRALHGRMQGYADDLARATGGEVAVGGPAARVLEYDEVLRDRLPLAILLLSFVTVITLVPVIRSLTLPIVSALLNLVTVGATFGVLALLFDGSFLGGPGHVDTTVLAGMVIVIFGLAIDYEVFVFVRMREEYERTGSSEAAIVNGLGHTARLVTGAAVIMIAVFLAFSIVPFASVRNFGIGLAIAVFIDAFIVRLVVLPALMRSMGKWCWWMPRWLDRMLPRLSHGPARPEAAPGG